MALEEKSGHVSFYRTLKISATTSFPAKSLDIDFFKSFITYFLIYPIHIPHLLHDCVNLPSDISRVLYIACRAGLNLTLCM